MRLPVSAFKDERCNHDRALNQLISREGKTDAVDAHGQFSDEVEMRYIFSSVRSEGRCLPIGQRNKDSVVPGH
jgi:hypothetical protein